jgi:hypothetical protein
MKALPVVAFAQQGHYMWATEGNLMDWPNRVNQILGEPPKSRGCNVLRDTEGPPVAHLRIGARKRKSSRNEELVKIASKLRQLVEKLSESRKIPVPLAPRQQPGVDAGFGELFEPPVRADNSALSG